jgi:hypothetical protein
MENHLDNPVILYQGYIPGPHINETKRQLPTEPRVNKACTNHYSLAAEGRTAPQGGGKIYW